MKIVVGILVVLSVLWGLGIVVAPLLDLWLWQTGRRTLSMRIAQLSRKSPAGLVFAALVVALFSFFFGLLIGGFAIHFFGWVEMP